MSSPAYTPVKCSDVSDLIHLPADDISSTELIGHDWMGSLFEVTTKSTKKLLVRVPKFDITQDELTQIVQECPREHFLNEITLTEGGVLITDVTGMDSLHTLNKFGTEELFVPVEEFEAVRIANRVLKILLKCQELHLDMFEVSPKRLYCKKIDGITARMATQGKANHEMWLSEPYMHLAILRLRTPDPPTFYFDKEYFDKSNRKQLSWSLSQLMFYLAYGTPYDDYYHENKTLSYSYTRTMFNLMKVRFIERSDLGEASRTFGPFINNVQLVLYPTTFVENFLMQKGVYTGTMRYGVMHGYGEFDITKSFGLYNEVKIYRGYIAYEKMHLTGEINYRNSEKYVGQISWDLPWGRGSLTTINGVIKQGNFEGLAMVDDEDCLIKYTDGSSIKGPTVKGVPNGMCVQVLADGTCLEGNFKLGKKHGLFTIRKYDPKDPDSLLMSFKGEFVDDKKHNKCVEYEVIGESECHFDGFYDMGSRTGSCKWSISGKFEYEGDLLNDLYHGYGTLTKQQDDGQEVYTGSFEKGKYNGWGELKTSDGTEYRGNFDLGTKSGMFEVTTADGSYRSVLYVDGYEMQDEM